MVQQAAALILADIREQQCDTEDSIALQRKLLSVAADGLHFQPPLLCLFLEQVVKPDFKNVQPLVKL